jgi:hypothetical protein
MHALDAAPYLAISTIDAVGDRKNKALIELERDEA